MQFPGFASQMYEIPETTVAALIIAGSAFASSRLRRRNT
jgi:hypothetical protein